jgi:hypothetical protein
MLVRAWPHGDEDSARSGPVAEVLREISRIDPELWRFTMQQLGRAEREPTLQPFEREGLAEKMPYADDLYEFKFPKGFRKKGVMRIYFCFDQSVRHSIWLLDAERKTEKEKKRKKKRHSAVVDRAEERAKVIRAGGTA